MKFKYKQIGAGLGFSPTTMLNSILKTRGVTSPSDFLNPSEKHIENFHLFDNMDNAVECLVKHIKAGNRIVIVPDGDFDGYSSSAELYLYLKRLLQHLNIVIELEYITHSKKAHGLTNEIMLKIEAGKYDLVLIPDASSNDYKEHAVLKKNGIDVIVLDHHQCDKYSEHAIVVNNQMSPKITNKAMTGVGVVYKFCKALDEYYNIKFADDYLDLVAVGMIADHANLADLESRYLVLKGLNLIQDGVNKNKFVTSIYSKKAYSMNKKVTIDSVAFYMCPYVNCIIRGGDAEMKSILFKAFIGEDGVYTDTVRGKGEVTYDIYGYMSRMYDKLKKIQDENKANGVAMLSKQIEEYGLNKSEIIVVNGEGLPNSEYNRIIVNQLCNNYHKHCILLRKYNKNLFGSAAGCKNREITNLRQWCNETGLFNYASGHNGAFGCELPIENINKLYEVISQIESTDMLTYSVDAVFTDKTLNKSIVETISRFSGLWGSGVEEPLFAIENVVLSGRDIYLMGENKNTIKLKINGIECIKFNASDKICNGFMTDKNYRFTVIGRFKSNEYRGNISPQIVIEDMDFEECTEVVKFKF